MVFGASAGWEVSPARDRPVRRGLAGAALRILAGLLAAACGPPADAPPPRPLERILDAKLGQQATVELPPGDGDGVLSSIRAAGASLDRAYWRQSAPGAWEEWQRLVASPRSLDRKRARLLQFHAGPFDRFQDREPFDGAAVRSPGGGFYPPYLTRDELRSQLREATREEREALLAPRTVLRWRDGRLVAVPHPQAFAGAVREAAAALRRAAALADHDGLRRRLLELADALQENRAPGPVSSDLEGSPIVLEIGALFTTEDRLLGRKLAYGAVAGRLDPEMTSRLARLSPDLAVLERGMPFPAFLRRWKDPSPATLVAARDRVRGGGAAHGELREASLLAGEAGPWLLVWRNLLEARRTRILLPILERCLEPADPPSLEDSLHVALLRPLGSQIGPSLPVPEIERSSWLAVVEEARADASGLLILEWLGREGRLSAEESARARVAWLADLFRRLRVGGPVRGPAATVALNWHHERGGVAHANARWRVLPDGLTSSAGELTRELVQILAAADQERARRLVHTYGPLGFHVRATLDRLSDLPREAVPVVPG